ncbi:hypothetical protein ABQE16_08800 [Enterococcus avium]|uniref:hypothetical protein n=1 Tax=Enterococcus TaxID=1350 RepID=UPI002090BE15|nr:MULTISPECIES: hypothetical protein [Enterococcus]MCO5489311.1 hypothetical protein [Enterococcus faecalis]MDT2493730.1 hypothetical protein [Enterococcus avium]
MERIKYYGNGYANKNQKEILEYINHIDLESNMTLEDIIEVFNIRQMIESNSWMDENNSFNIFNTETSTILGRFYSKYQLDSDAINDYNSLENLYYKDFWQLFVRFGLIKRTTIPVFKTFIEETQVTPMLMLQHESIVKKYSSVLRDYLLKTPRYFELFINYFDSTIPPVFNFPSGFTEEEINDWARRYCELSDNNSNYLERICNWSEKQEYKIRDKTKLLANKVKKENLTKLFSENTGHTTKMEVEFSEQMESDFKFEDKGAFSFKLTFNKKWLLNNLDNRTILMNYIYFFGFYNPFDGFSYAQSGYESEGLLELLQPKSRYGYRRGFSQKTTDNMWDLVFLAYFDFLQYQGKDLEEIFGSFYSEYIEEDYNQSGFFFSPSSKNVSYYERCKALIPEMDGVLKQYELLREEGEIDEELYAIGSKGKSYQNLESFSTKKFCYFKSERIVKLANLLFSNQSILAADSEKDEKKFFIRIIKGAAKSDFNKYQLPTIEKLIEEKVLGVSIANQLYFRDEIMINCLLHIWSSGYMNLLYCPTEVVESINKLYENDDVRYGDTLFSEQEADMISYYMDDKKFGNSMAIRNKITHGRATKKNASEAKMYYLKLLTVLLLYTIRISEELDLLELVSEGIKYR